MRLAWTQELCLRVSQTCLQCIQFFAEGATAAKVTPGFFVPVFGVFKIALLHMQQGVQPGGSARIIVLDKGQLVEQGTHTELIAHAGVYAGLAALQFAA